MPYIALNTRRVNLALTIDIISLFSGVFVDPRKRQDDSKIVGGFHDVMGCSLFVHTQGRIFDKSERYPG